VSKETRGMINIIVSQLDTRQTLFVHSERRFFMPLEPLYAFALTCSELVASSATTPGHI